MNLSMNSQIFYVIYSVANTHTYGSCRC